MYDLVHFEISGLCNAHCPWCVQGRGFLQKEPSRFIPPTEFQKAIERLFEESLINTDTIIALYNYGEPLLHPSFEKILGVLSNNKLRYMISTNASRFVRLDKDLLRNLHKFFISIPGFSQDSYSRIHGFKFEDVLKIMNKWIDIIGPERIQIQYHIYQFNLDEIKSASDYFKERDVTVYPYCALFNDYAMSKSYLNGTLPEDIMEKASRELILYYVDNYLLTLSEDQSCPQQQILTIDEYCNVLTCCVLSKRDPDYSIGSLFSLTRDEIQQKKASCGTCKECLGMGIAYWMHNVYCPNFIQNYLL